MTNKSSVALKDYLMDVQLCFLTPIEMKIILIDVLIHLLCHQTPV